MTEYECPQADYEKGTRCSSSTYVYYIYIFTARLVEHHG